jgi:hypothetical protein
MESHMKIAVTLTTLASLVGSMSLALAQSPAEQSSPSKCWDAPAEQVRTRTQPAEQKSRDALETTVGEGSSEGMSAIAPGSKGSASKTLPGTSGNPDGRRPPGLPDC